MSAAVDIDLFSTPMQRLAASLPVEDLSDLDGLRYYQRDAVTAIMAGFKEYRTQLLVMATGLGKTQVFCVVAQYWPDGDILILAHRDELIDQARARYEKMFGGFVDIEKGDFHASLRSHIVVGSVQSLYKKRREKMSRQRFGLIIIDEAHRATAKSYRDIIEYFESAKILGVTATPDRTDEKAMGTVFENVPFVMDIEDGIEAGYLVPIVGKSVEVKEIDISQVSTSGGDLVARELDEAMIKAVDPIVLESIRLSGAEQAIGFFPGCRSAEYAMHRFNREKPGSCCYVDAKTETFERKSTVKAFRNNQYQYFANVLVASEGFDAPSTSIICQARPTKSRALYAQQIGRGTRVLPGVVDHLHGPENASARRDAIARSAKPHMVVLDFVGNSGRHSLQTVEDILGGKFSEDEISLAKKKRKEGTDALAALKEARRELEALARAKKIQAKVVVRDFDPFRVFGMALGDEQRNASRFGLVPATDAQLHALRRHQIPEEDLKGLSKTAAQKLFGTIKKRIDLNLANYHQMRYLQQFGVYDKNIGFNRANEALAYLSTTGFGNRAPVDSKRLNEILHRRRDAGDDV